MNTRYMSQPSSSIMLGDSYYNGTQWAQIWLTTSAVNLFRLNHGDRCAMAFLEGHVSTCAPVEILKAAKNMDVKQNESGATFSGVYLFPEKGNSINVQ